MEYNWKVLLNEDMLDDSKCGLVNVTLSPDREIFCDSMVDWKYVKEFNQVFHDNKPDSFVMDDTRTEILMYSVISNSINISTDSQSGSSADTTVALSSFKNNRYQLDYFIITMGSDHREFICMYEISNINKFWIVTCDSHPGVDTADFSYVNSDGSGPSLIYDRKNFHEIYNGFYDAFNEICRDNYH